MTPGSILSFSKLINDSSKIVVFSGAGISTESGISDYRSKGGVWDKFQPITIQEFLSEKEKRILYWERKREMYKQMREAKPNLGHLAIATLEEKGKLLGLITQNIDGLHQEAGSKNVCEIHGSNRETICLKCGRLDPFEFVYERLEAGEKAPLCELCGGLLKPNTISFGQNLNPETLQQSMLWIHACDLMIVVGSSLVVEPAASMPARAKERGKNLVIINRDPTPYDTIADLVFHSSIGELLNQVVA